MAPSSRTFYPPRVYTYLSGSEFQKLCIWMNLPFLAQGNVWKIIRKCCTCQPSTQSSWQWRHNENIKRYKTKQNKKKRIQIKKNQVIKLVVLSDGVDICVFCPLSWSLYFVFQMLNQVVNGVVLFHGGHLWHCSPPFSTPHNHKTLYFVFYTLHFVICISNAPLPLLTPYNRKTASNSKVNTRTKNSIKTSWPLMIIHKLQEKNILRKKLYCFTIFRTFRQGSVSQGRVPVDVEGVSSNK